ncbi:MAG: glycosyl hydrolase family 2 [Bacteroidaceae bacterium]|nr:glycosyl hydrolase family 2 [Bacteroidaceae bacterium]
MKLGFFTFCISLFTVCPAASAQATWNGPQDLHIPITQESKPYARWWWLGSAVDKEGLTYNLEEMAKAGMGGVEITPIYGVQGNDANEISYLSPTWMQLLKHTEAEGARLGIQIDMATGTGWPFGGPLVTEQDAATKAIFKKEANGTTVEVGKTKQKVKRAAPGGEGFVIDHFNKDAVARYLERFDTAFVNQHVSFPKNFFNDSYEVYGADWTPNLQAEFQARRGYDLYQHLSPFTTPDSLRTDEDKRILSDYRETLGELLYENFTLQWTDWAHKHGSLTRNQAHGSPANLLDLYAAVDIPECEGFGLSDFGIRGLRKDPGFTKKNFSDISMLKYASSGAHLSGHRLTSSETFTWLTEHFRTSLSQCKPDLDLFFISGINHVYFHGACYSPKDAEWPGWRFYASVDMSPNNNWWSCMPAFSTYIQRCQSMLQWGEPDNDILVYLPFYDMIYDQPGTVALFDIHSMEKRAPKFINTVQTIIKGGYDVDYISDRYIQDDNVTRRYAAIIIPDVQFMPLATAQKLNELATKGYKVIFVKNYPTSVPGYGKKAEQKAFLKILKSLTKNATLAEDYQTALQSTKARPETMRSVQGLSCIRRSNPEGYHYFISNLQGKDVDSYVELGVKAADALFYNPMNGDITRAKMDMQGRVRIQLRSGESILLRTFTGPSPNPSLYGGERRPDGLPPHYGGGLGRGSVEVLAHSYYNCLDYRAGKLTNWTLSFKEAAPTPITKTWTMNTPKSWTELGDSLCNTTMATGVYKTTFRLGSIQPGAAFILDLGDVRETAHVFVNGQDCGILFAVPYRMDITQYSHEGENTLEVEVCNLPANRIAELDRQGVKWRKFKEINVVDLNYKKNLYDTWTLVPSGLCSEVKIIPATIE